jgi:hypothetical protein
MPWIVLLNSELILKHLYYNIITLRVDIANFGLSLAAGTNNSPYCLEEDYN